ncbi:MAG: sugar ABC transporter permease [Armatimonadetes bacterium]|nr:sugar ABC transporter permease [Armatimonadota bacterium]
MAAARSQKVGYLFITPAVLHLLVFAILPIGYALYLSLFRWNLLKETKPFVGLGNYVDSVQDPHFWNAMWNSARYTMTSVPVGMLVALAVAILVAQKLRGVTIFRTLYYIPAISSGVAISMLWIYVYLPTNGLINVASSMFGIPDIDFLNKEEWAMWALVFMSLWTGLGPKMIIFVAGLLGIPETLYEAAELDGAGGWQRFWRITIPMLSPTTLFVLVTSTIGAFQLFTPIYMMTKGGPNDTTNVIGYHIYREAWQKFHVGSAAAQSFLLLIIIAGVAYAQYRMMKSQLEGYAAG